MNELIRFGVSIPAKLIDAFDRDTKKKGYRTRSEAIRDMMRDYLVETEWENNACEVVGTVTIVYDRHTRELSNVLNKFQHDHHDEVVCMTHVHMDHDNCLEVIVVKGSSERVRTIADQIVSTKGVKHGKLVCTTTGKALR